MSLISRSIDYLNYLDAVFRLVERKVKQYSSQMITNQTKHFRILYAPENYMLVWDDMLLGIQVVVKVSMSLPPHGPDKRYSLIIVRLGVLRCFEVTIE